MKAISTTAVIFATDEDKVTHSAAPEAPQIAKFWTVVVDKKGTAKASPCWDCIRHELIEMGFRTWWPEGTTGKLEFVRVRGNVLDPFEPEGIKNLFVSEHIDSMQGEQIIEDGDDGEPFTFPAEQLKESFWRVMGNNFSASQLASLPPLTDKILRDTRDAAYYAFKNCVIEVRKDEKIPIDYKDLKGQCVWRSHIKQHEFGEPEGSSRGMFEEFIENVAGHKPEKIASYRSAFGYLLHNYTPASVTKWVQANDETTASKDAPQGRTGKGIVGNALKQMRKTHQIDGKQYKPQSEFFWQGLTKETQIVWVDDLNEEFDFKTLFSASTEGMQAQRKFKSTLTFTREESPKGYVTTNTPLNLRGSSNKDRLHVLTFSDFYSSKINSGTGRPVLDVHGKEFFSEEWDVHEWNRFYGYMIACVQYYLNVGLQAYECPSIKKNQLINCTSLDFYEWVTDPELEDGGRIDDGIPRADDALLSSYRAASGDGDLKQRTFNRYLRNYAEVQGLKFNKKKSNGKNKVSFEVNSAEVP